MWQDEVREVVEEGGELGVGLGGRTLNKTESVGWEGKEPNRGVLDWF